MNTMADVEINGKIDYSLGKIIHCIFNQHKFTTDDEIKFYSLKIKQLKNCKVCENFIRLHNYLLKKLDLFFWNRGKENEFKK